MPNVTLYHNPRCSKSRQTLELIRAAGVEPVIIEYLKQPLDAQRIKELLKKLQMPAAQLVRRKEKCFAELELDDSSSEDEWIAAMVQHPILIERPIVAVGDQARLGRPPEHVLEIL